MCDIRGHAVGVRQHLPCMLQERRSQMREFVVPPAPPVEQLALQLPFQRLDMRADRGLRHSQLVGRRTKSTAIRDCGEDLQASEGELRPMLHASGIGKQLSPS